jgi:hypothetical protein
LSIEWLRETNVLKTLMEMIRKGILIDLGTMLVLQIYILFGFGGMMVAWAVRSSGFHIILSFLMAGLAYPLIRIRSIMAVRHDGVMAILAAAVLFPLVRGVYLLFLPSWRSQNQESRKVGRTRGL